MEPKVIAEMGETALEWGPEIIEEGVEILENVGEGLQQTVHAIFYPVDTAEKVIGYFEGPQSEAPPNIEYQDQEETTMRSSSVSHEDAPPPAH
jgi:hypothetical protein